MKIAIVFDGLGFGGIERVGIDYIKILLELGHSVDVYNLTPIQNAMESQLPSECQVYHVKFPRKISPEMYSYGVKKYWWGKYVYPIIHLALSVFLTIRRFFFKRRKYDLSIAFSGHFNDLTFVAKGFVVSPKKLCWLHGALYGYILITSGFLNLYQQIKNLVVLSKIGQEKALFSNKYLKLNITQIYNPTFITEKTLDKVKVEELNQEYGKFLLVVARFSYPEKDHYTVIDAVNVLKNKYGIEIKAIFVGDGPEEQKVKDYCKQNGVSEQIVFTGSRMDVQNYYQASEMLVHASASGEGLPTVVLEAMSFGKPVVITDSYVGPREIIGNDEFGLLCKNQDPEDMAQQIMRLLIDKELYCYYQQQGYKRVTDFHPQVISKQLENLLASIES